MTLYQPSLALAIDPGTSTEAEVVAEVVVVVVMVEIIKDLSRDRVEKSDPRTGKRLATELDCNQFGLDCSCSPRGCAIGLVVDAEA